MVRRTIAGAVVVGAMTLGIVGGAGAAATTTIPSTAPSSGSTTTTTPVTPSCAALAKLLQRHNASELKAGARLHKAEAMESRLRKLGHAKLAGKLAQRDRASQSKQKRIIARLHKDVRACAGASRSGSSKSSGSTTGSTSSTSSTSSTGSTSSTVG